MINATVIGYVGKSELRHERGDFPVLRFSVASNTKQRDQKITTWIDCSVVGKRAEALAEHLSKGSHVAVVGQLTTREHEGRTYLKLQVAELELLGRPQQPAGQQHRSEPVQPRTPAAEAPREHDDIPF